MKKAIITGISGQDGSYLAELLIEKGYQVNGIVRRSSTSNTKRIDHLLKNKSKNLIMHCGDLSDPHQLDAIITEVQPDEIYNLGAQTDVKVSLEQPTFTTNVNAIGCLSLLEAIRYSSKHSKIYQASTSEMFGGINVPSTGYDESSIFTPRNPYAVCKLYSYWMIRVYRESYGIFASNGILFNHESPRRGSQFVTKKITEWCGKYYRFTNKLGPKPDILELGNINTFRDWGHAKDFVEAIYLIMQAPEAEDWLISTGETHSVQEFIEKCFQWINVQIEWRGEELNKEGLVNGEAFIKINSKYFRPSEVNVLLGNSMKARIKLGWKPKYTLDLLIDDMMKSEIGNED